MFFFILHHCLPQGLHLHLHLGTASYQDRLFVCCMNSPLAFPNALSSFVVRGLLLEMHWLLEDSLILSFLDDLKMDLETVVLAGQSFVLLLSQESYFGDVLAAHH